VKGGKENDMKAVLSIAYFGPVQWFQKLHRADTVYIEQHESFIKQTYRNRCVIATTHGTQMLTVPVEHTSAPSSSGRPLSIRDLRISAHNNWQHVHWNALMTAYGESPFFDYYVDDIRPFFEKKWDYLFDFNMEITNKMCELLDIHPHIQLTESYQSASQIRSSRLSLTDYREVIRPKHPLQDEDFQPKSYYQVYAQKNGFFPNLSILDLLFNMGNEAIFYL